MAGGESNPEERPPNAEWRLGVELPELHPAPAAGPVAREAPDLSRQRLTRPLYVLTAEHAGWLAVVAYLGSTRAVALGARPLDPAGASAALAAYGLARGGLASLQMAAAPAVSWIQIVEAWIFSAAGASDATARLVVAAGSLILVAAAFAMRRYLGRAGALALAVLLALSPSMTYFSRGGAPAVASMAFMAAAIALALGMSVRATGARAVALGGAIALWVAADPIGYSTAATVIAALVLVGVPYAIAGDHRRLRLRVWWERRRAIAIVTTVVAIGGWAALTSAFFVRPLIPSLVANLRAAFAIGPVGPAFARNIRAFAPILGFYEFAIVILAPIGIFAIAARRAGGPFVLWLLAWSVISVAFFLSLGADRPDAVVAIILPVAMLSAYGIEWLHHSARWDAIRLALAAGCALTLYVQVLTNFVYQAPEAGEAAWNRHALLYWPEPTTTVRTPRECARAAKAVAADAPVSVSSDAPQVAWYLRDFQVADNAESAAIVATVGSTAAGAAAGNSDRPEFAFEETWKPDFRALGVVDALRYIFTMRAWSDVEIRSLELDVRRPAGTSAPPSTSAPAPAPSAPASPSPSPTATESPAPSPTVASGSV